MKLNINRITNITTVLCITNDTTSNLNFLSDSRGVIQGLGDKYNIIIIKTILLFLMSGG